MGKEGLTAPPRPRNRTFSLGLVLSFSLLADHTPSGFAMDLRSASDTIFMPAARLMFLCVSLRHTQSLTLTVLCMALFFIAADSACHLPIWKRYEVIQLKKKARLHAALLCVCRTLPGGCGGICQTRQIQTAVATRGVKTSHLHVVPVHTPAPDPASPCWSAPSSSRFRRHRSRDNRRHRHRRRRR